MRPVPSLDLLVCFASLVVPLVVALPQEEQKLIATFGDGYRNYQLRTPAFIPLWPTQRVSGDCFGCSPGIFAPCPRHSIAFPSVRAEIAERTDGAGIGRLKRAIM